MAIVTYLSSVWWYRLTLESAVIMFGVPGNLLIIQVYASKKVTVTPHVYIIGLAVADFSVCLLRIITLVQLISPIDTFSASSQFFCRVSSIIDAWPKYTSILLTTAVAVDRYLAICRPHGHRLSVRRARQTVYACFAVSLVFMLPNLFMYGVVSSPNGTVVCQFVVPSAVVTAQFTILMISVVASFVIIVVLYVKVYRTVNRMAKVRPGNTVHRGMHGSSRVSHNDSTARAEGIPTSRLVIAVISHKNNPEPQQDKTISEFEAQVKPHQPQTRAKTFTDPLPVKTAWTDDHQLMKELPILQPPTEGAGPSTSHHTTHNNSSLASLSPQAKNKATSTESHRLNEPKFHKKTTLMLLLSTIVFVVTLLPFCIVLMVFPVISSHFQSLFQNKAVVFLFNVASYLNLVNNVANPVLFSIINHRFREDMKRSLRKLFCRGCHFRD